jgi:hypothetical protein
MNVTGSLFLTFLVITFAVVGIVVMLGGSYELSAIVVMPMLFVFAHVTGDVVVLAVVLLYLGSLMAKLMISRF